MVNYPILLVLFIGLMSAIFLSDLPGDYIPYSYLILITSCGLIYLGIKTSNYYVEIEDWKKKKIYEGKIDELKRSGAKIQVDLKNCKIRSQSIQEEVPVKSYKIGIVDSRAIDGLYESSRTTTVRETNNSNISYKHKINGKIYTFSSHSFNKDEVTLQFQLADKKHTYIYYDQANPKNYFFDLDFLDE